MVILVTPDATTKKQDRGQFRPFLPPPPPFFIETGGVFEGSTQSRATSMTHEQPEEVSGRFYFYLYI